MSTTQPAPMQQNRRLQVFLCHATGDKEFVRDLYARLKRDGFAPWMDEKDLLPGQRWQEEIPAAVRKSDVVIVCLSQKSVSKEGYLQREIRYALDQAEEKPEGTIFIIPVRIEEVAVPKHLSEWQWADLFDEDGYRRLITALNRRAQGLELDESVPQALLREMGPEIASNPQGDLNLQKLPPQQAPTCDTEAKTSESSSLPQLQGNIRTTAESGAEQIGRKEFVRRTVRYRKWLYATPIAILIFLAMVIGRGYPAIWAMYKLGLLYDNGHGVARNYETARFWYQKAANAGNPSAMNSLGLLYDNGHGIAQDYDEARRWYKQAAEAGNPAAMNNLGFLYHYGHGVAQDYDEARRWYKQAADAGNPSAMYNLGFLYHYGQGVAQDYDEARRWYQKAAEAGEQNAQKKLQELPQ